MIQKNVMQSQASPSQGMVFRIKKFAVHDGPGIRTTVFLKGCPLDCWWCHNPEGRDPNPEIMRSGKPGEKGEIIGTIYSVDALLEEIEKDVIFYDDSGGGVTFSGGEPLFQFGFLHAVVRKCRERGIHTTLDTTGFAPEPVLKKILPDIDLFLFDLKMLNNEKHVRYTGVSNKRILENFKTIVTAGKTVRVRFPVIPGITDQPDNIRDMVRFVSSHGGIEQIDLLPFHKIADGKYTRLGKKNRMGNTDSLAPEDLSEIRNYFESKGFAVKIGG